MPFYGRPSKNCESCRDRRIKCDRIQPVCSQCRRAGKPCGGYRDVPALLFRDETDKAARRSATAKSRAGERRKITVSSSSDSDSSSPGSLASTDDQLKAIVQSWWNNPASVTFTIPAVVSSNVEDQGLKFFLTQFVTAVSGVEEGPFIISSSPLLKTLAKELPLRDAVVSVGLAALANVTRDRCLHTLAREKYLGAINTVRQAVENPKQANPDQTLKLILMLSLYEMVCCSANQVDMWVVHLDGAAALLKQRAFSRVLQAREPRAQMQFYYISMVKYFLAQGSLPAELLEFDKKNFKSSNPDDYTSIDLIDILVRFMKLYSTRYDPDFDPEASIQAAIAFDAELENWEKSLPEKWRFRVEYSSDMEHTFRGTFMVYQDVWASRDINHYLWGRIIVNELIMYNIATLSLVGRLAPSHLELQRRSLEIASRMAMYACAAAASQLGSYAHGIPVQKNKQLPPLNGVFMLLFPLTIAGSSPAVPEDVHEWVVERFQKIGTNMGIQRALKLIPRMKRCRVWKSKMVRLDLSEVDLLESQIGGEWKPEQQGQDLLSTWPEGSADFRDDWSNSSQSGVEV